MLVAGQQQERREPASASGGEIGCQGIFAGAAQAFGVSRLGVMLRTASDLEFLSFALPTC